MAKELQDGSGLCSGSLGKSYLGEPGAPSGSIGLLKSEK